MRDVALDAPVEGLDLKGVPDALHDLMIELHAERDADSMNGILASARNVMPNANGTVVVKFSGSVTAKGKDVDRTRLRAIKARDYMDGTTRELVESVDFGATIALGAALAEDPAAIAELPLCDARSVYYAVAVLRKNWFGPKT